MVRPTARNSEAAEQGIVTGGQSPGAGAGDRRRSVSVAESPAVLPGKPLRRSRSSPDGHHTITYRAPGR